MLFPFFLVLFVQTIQDNKLSGTVPDAVKAHANWSKWDAEKYIFPQQEGYGLQ